MEMKSLEYERDYETRVFCVFFNNKTGNYRVTQADAVIVDNLKVEVSFAEALSAMIKEARACGEKICKKDIKMR